jgi:hypothetical protein
MSINKLAVSTIVISSLILGGCSSTNSTKQEPPTPETPNYTVVDQIKDTYAARVDGDWGNGNDIENPIERDTAPNLPTYTIADQLKDAYSARVDSEWEVSGIPMNPIEPEQEFPIYHEPTNPNEKPDFGDTPEFGLYKVVYDAENGQLKIYDRSNKDATLAIITIEHEHSETPTIVIRHGAMESDNTYAIIKTDDGIAIDWDSPYTKIDGGFNNPLANDTVIALLNSPVLTEQEQLKHAKTRLGANQGQTNKQHISKIKAMRSQLSIPKSTR